MLRDFAGLADPLLYALPLWLAGLLLIAACLVALLIGSTLRRRSSRFGADASSSERSDAEAHIIAAIFGLLAFLLGITFSIAVDRYDKRRDLVAEEASAISDAYYRASLFDDPDRSRVQNLLRQYARTRVAPGGLWDDAMERKLRKEAALRDRLWDATRTATYPLRTTELSSLLVGAVNDTVNVGRRRELAGRAHIPTRILDALVLYLLASSVALGYLTGTSSRGRRFSAILLVVLFAVLIVLIIDLDRPRAGTIRVPQRALEELVVALDRDFRRHHER